MTSGATIAAAIPPAMAIGPGAEVRIPMSIAIIGGVIVSTFFLSLSCPAFTAFSPVWNAKKPRPIPHKALSFGPNPKAVK